MGLPESQALPSFLKRATQPLRSVGLPFMFILGREKKLFSVIPPQTRRHTLTRGKKRCLVGREGRPQILQPVHETFVDWLFCGVH